LTTNCRKLLKIVLIIDYISSNKLCLLTKFSYEFGTITVKNNIIFKRFDVTNKKAITF